MESGLINLKDTVTSNESSIENLSSNIALNAESLDGITESMNTNKNTLDDITGKITTNKDKLVSLQTKINNNSNKLQTIVNKVSLLSNTLQSNEQQNDIFEGLLRLGVPALNRPMIRKLLAPLFYAMLKAIKDHPEMSLISNDLTMNINDNLDLLLKNVNIDTVFARVEPCIEGFFKQLSGQSVSIAIQTDCMNMFVEHVPFWYSIYKNIHQNIKNEHTKIKFPDYNVVSYLLNESDYRLIRIGFKTMKDVLRLIRLITEDELIEIFSFYPYNFEAFSTIMNTQIANAKISNIMSSEYVTPVLMDNFMDNVLQTMREDALNIEQRHLGYDEGYTHGLYDGGNNIDSNYRVD